MILTIHSSGSSSDSNELESDCAMFGCPYVRIGKNRDDFCPSIGVCTQFILFLTAFVNHMDDYPVIFVFDEGDFWLAEVCYHEEQHRLADGATVWALDHHCRLIDLKTPWPCDCHHCAQFH